MLWLTTACSFAFVQSPPSEPDDAEAQVANDCTSSSVLPALDVSGMVVSGANVALVASSSAWDSDEKEILVPLHAAYGVLYGISAVYGFSETARCRELKERFERNRGTWQPKVKESK